VRYSCCYHRQLVGPQSLGAHYDGLSSMIHVLASTNLVIILNSEQRGVVAAGYFVSRYQCSEPCDLSDDYGHQALTFLFLHRQRTFIFA